MPGKPHLSVIVDADTTKLQSSLTGATGTISKFGESLPTTRIEAVIDGVKKVARFTHDLTTAGRDAAAAEAEFGRSMQNLGVDMAAMTPQINDAIIAAQKLGFTDDEVRDAIETLTRGTGDAVIALANLPGVIDLARNANKTLGETADAVGKTFSTQSDAFVKRLLPALQDSGGAMDTLGQAYQDSKGSAETWAKSAEGSSAVMQIAMSEAAESVGGTLATAFSDAREALKPLLAEFRKLMIIILPVLTPLVQGLGDAFTAVLGAIGLMLETAVKIAGWARDIIGDITDVITKIDEAIGKSDELSDQEILDRFANSGWTGGPGRFGKGSKGARTRGNGPTVGPMAAAPSGRTSSSGGVQINIYGDPATIESKVARALRDYTRRNGPANILNPGRL